MLALADAPSAAEVDEAVPAPAPAKASVGQRIGTALIVAGPLVALAVALLVFWGRAVHLRDVVIGFVLYVVTGHGITVGFHRMLTHGSFRPRRGLKIALTIAGAMAVQGSPISWVANHRSHHVHSDHPGDPHSPHDHGRGARATISAFFHAHMGWLFRPDESPASRYAPDLLRDRDVVAVSRWFPAFAIASLVLPLLLGWALAGTLHGAFTAFLWAGVVRMALLHHVTWSINSICHVFGRRPFRTKDQSGNVRALAVLSFGESWHNLHHAIPASARHGVDRGQLDSSARLIRIFEQLGWATRVRWAQRERIESVRLPGQDRRSKVRTSPPSASTSANGAASASRSS